MAKFCDEWPVFTKVNLGSNNNNNKCQDNGRKKHIAFLDNSEIETKGKWILFEEKKSFSPACGGKGSFSSLCF